jgi:prepilin-type N-terminal cleavage/methylation domain-containing protein
MERGYITMDKRGFTLVELLMALLIASFLMAGVYRLLVAEVKTYNYNEKSLEVEQSLMAATEILVRDLRVGGFDDPSSDAVAINDSVTVWPSKDKVRISYEQGGEAKEITYAKVGKKIKRTERGKEPEDLLGQEEPYGIEVKLFYMEATRKDGCQSVEFTIEITARDGVERRVVKHVNLRNLSL